MSEEDPHPCDECGGPWGRLSPVDRFACGVCADREKRMFHLCRGCIVKHDLRLHMSRSHVSSADVH